jgi:hypothetical protein
VLDLIDSGVGIVGHRAGQAVGIGGGPGALQVRRQVARVGHSAQWGKVERWVIV